MNSLCVRACFLMFSFAFANISFAQFYWENPLPQNNELTDISALEEGHVWAVGEKGIMLKYDGTAWSQEFFSKDIRFITVQLTSPNNGWATGWDRTESITDNIVLHYNGEQWNEVSTNLPEHLLPSAAFFLDESTGWVVLDGNIYKLSNGIWSEEENTTSIKSLFFLDENNGWATGNGGAILYYNGDTWNTQATNVTGVITNLYMIDSDSGWAVTQNGTFLKYNGSSWSEEQDFSGSIWDIYLISENEGWAIGSQVFKFENGIWTEESYDLPETMSAFSFTSQNNFWAVGEEGEIVRLEGNSWSNAKTGIVADRNVIWMTDENNGFAGGFGSGIHIYENGEWSLDTLYADGDIIPSISDVHFFDKHNGWAVRNSDIYKLENGIWTTDQNNLPNNFDAIHFSDPEHGWIVGGIGRNYKFQEGVWEEEERISFLDLNDVFVLSDTEVWAAGNFGTLLKYNGTNWEEIDLSTNLDFFAIEFINENEAWLVGENGIMFQYDGDEWMPVVSNSNYDLLDIFFLDENLGWAVGQAGTILQFNGSDWIPLFSNVESTLNSVFFTDENKGWVAGRDGVVLSTMNGGGLISNTEEISSYKKILTKAYPNPSSDHFFIEFTMTSSSKVLVNLFDSNGKFVGNYSNEYYGEGKQQIAVPISRLLPGVYYYQFSIDGFTETKKIIIQ